MNKQQTEILYATVSQFCELLSESRHWVTEYQQGLLDQIRELVLKVHNWDDISWECAPKWLERFKVDKKS